MTEQTATPAEEKAPKAPKVNVEELFPKGSLVEFTATDFKGQQGVVNGFEEKLGVQYLQVTREVLVNGRRPKEPKSSLVRHTSVQKIDAYREEPAPAPAPAEGETEAPKGKGK